MKALTDPELLEAAQSLARRSGLFIIAKAGKFHVYRKAAPRNVWVGYKRKPGELLRYIEQLATTK